MTTPKTLRAPLSLLWLALLAACGGGSQTPVTVPAAATATISGKAVDGPLQGATACYDINDNGNCDAAEPSFGPTDAEGAFRITVPLTEAGRHRVVVMVPASAIDKDTGTAVGSAFTLRAPASGNGADHSVFVSPLTTLVLAHMERHGTTLADAVELVRTQAGLALSPLADFTAGSSNDHRHAALVARLVQLAALAQTDELRALVGTTDRTGTLITQAVLDAEVASSLIGALPAVAGAAIDPALAAASGSTLQDLLGVLARALVAQVGLSNAQLQAGATAVALAEPPFVPGVASAALTSLSYTDQDNWFMRTLQSSAEDNIPDAQNRTRYYDVRTESFSTSIGAQGRSYSYAAGGNVDFPSDLHFNGTAWVSCSLTSRFVSGLRDAQGRHTYNFCDSLEQGNGLRKTVDISGRSMLAVVRDLIRSFPGSSQGIAYANWGPADLGLYGSAVFPAGSNLQYQTNTVTQTAAFYNPDITSAVTAFNAAVAAGGDVRVNPALACADPLQNITTAMTPVVSLEDLIARNPGKACIFNQGGATPDFSLNPNEWWGNSTVSLGNLANTNDRPVNTGNYYSRTARLRVSFAASGNRVTFYRCFSRTSDASARNCSVLGIGTRSIQTQGDARVMSFSVMPALAQKLGNPRVFIERGGSVYFGNKSPVGRVTTDVRLNLPAANAVLEQIGLPRIRPVSQPGTATGARAAALATLKGAWGGADPIGGFASVFRWGDNGRFFMAEAKPFLPLTNEQSGAELGWFDYDPVTKRISSLLEVDSNLTSGTSHPAAVEMTAQFNIGASALTNSAGDVLMTRLETAPTGMVGLWALGSATDLSVPHLALFSNGRFMLVHHQGNPLPGDCFNGSAGDGQCPPGVEFGSYTYTPAGTAPVTPATMRFFALQYDTNGCAGAFSSCPAAVAIGAVNTEVNFVVVLSADGTTVTTQRGTDPVLTWFRVPPL